MGAPWFTPQNNKRYQPLPEQEIQYHGYTSLGALNWMTAYHHLFSQVWGASGEICVSDCE